MAVQQALVKEGQDWQPHPLVLEARRFWPHCASSIQRDRESPRDASVEGRRTALFQYACVVSQ